MEKDWKNEPKKMLEVKAMDKIINEQRIPPREEDAEIFEEWCFERFEDESDIPEDAYEIFCEEDQGNEPDYIY